jgi:hypothetical protein
MIMFPPGRFSITNGWPRRWCIGSESARKKMSLTPPGLVATMIRIGRVGYSCARATDPCNAPAMRLAAIRPVAIRKATNRNRTVAASSLDFFRVDQQTARRSMQRAIDRYPPSTKFRRN